MVYASLQFLLKRWWNCRSGRRPADLLGSVMQASPGALTLGRRLRTCAVQKRNSCGCVPRRDKSFSLIPSPPHLGGVENFSHRLQEMEMGGRGRNVNLRIISAVRSSGRERFTETELQPQGWSMMSCLIRVMTKNKEITDYVADVIMERELGKVLRLSCGENNSQDFVFL